MTRARRQHTLSGFVLLCSIGFVACRAGDGACFVKNAEPLITIASVQDSASHAQIGDVTISNVSFEGSPVANLEFLVNPDRAPTSQVTVDAQSIRCKVACGFASVSGKYSFVLAATGYRARTVAVDARYAEVASGCPSLLKRGVSISEILSKL